MIGLNSRSLVELADVRRLLESGAAELAPPRSRPDELDELRGRDRRAARCGTVQPARFIELDARFHRVIHVAARNGLLLALLDGMSGLAERSRTITGRQPGVCWRPRCARTTRIYEALAAHDPVARDARCSSTWTTIRSALDRALEQPTNLTLYSRFRFARLASSPGDVEAADRRVGELDRVERRERRAQRPAGAS